MAICPTLWATAPKHPATHPRKALIAAAEEALDSEALIEAAIAGTEVIEVG